MSDLRTAAQQALEALKGYRREMACGQPCDAERVLEATLAQEQPSPINQCGETCERAKLCAICARGIEQEQPDTDCHAQGICQRSGYSIGEQQEQEWLTGCPECGMDSGCDCDSGTWHMKEQEQEQEPVGIVTGKLGTRVSLEAPTLRKGDRVYTAPPARKPLTEAEIERLVQTYSGYCQDDFVSVARAIERAHGIGGSDE